MWPVLCGFFRSCDQYCVVSLDHVTSTVVSLDLPWSKWEIWFYSDWHYIQLYYSTYAYTFSIWNFHIKQMIHVVHVYKWYMSCRYTNDTCRAGIQMIYVMHYYLHIIQWNLSKPNLLVTNICVWNRQVFGLYRLNEQRFLH
jgi:hypothetical protein